MHRSQEDHDFLFANDQKLAEISAKSYYTRTANEIDYMQKAVGFVNTFAHLSSAEKALHDETISGGNIPAAEGIAQIALIRQGGEMDGRWRQWNDLQSAHHRDHRRQHRVVLQPQHR